MKKEIENKEVNKESKTSAKNEGGDFFTDAFKWKVDEETIKKELENYNNLYSAKNMAAIFILFFGGITGLLFNIYSVIHWVNLFIYIALALLIYLGSRWAIIFVMVVWTYDGGMNTIGHLLSDNSWGIIWTIFWWAMGMKLMWKASQVEMTRKRKMNDKNNQSLQKPIGLNISSEEQSYGESQINYCSRCRYKLEKNSKFCPQCGIKI